MLKLVNKVEFENNLWLAEINIPENIIIDNNSTIEFVTDIASISRGRLEFTGKNRRRLFNHLIIESAGKPSTPFEFVPRIIGLNSIVYSEHNKILRYGYVYGDMFYTNMRVIFNIRYNFKELTDRNKIKNFKIIVGEIPFKVISHLVRHRTFSFIVESSRNKKYLNEVEFWYPSWWNDNLIKNFKYSEDPFKLSKLRELVNNGAIKPEEATMELSDRRLVLFAMAGWLNDENTWKNLFEVRSAKNTMSITSIVINKIKEIIYNK